MRPRDRAGSATSIASAYGTRTTSLRAPPHSRRAIGAIPYAAPAPAVVQLAESPAPASVAHAAADLERDDDAIAGPHAGHVGRNLEDVGHELVTERERAGEWRPTCDDRGIEIARRHGDRSHERVGRAGQFGRGHVFPLQTTRAFERELPHRPHSVAIVDDAVTPRRRSAARWCGARRRGRRDRAPRRTTRGALRPGASGAPAVRRGGRTIARGRRPCRH